MEVGVAAGRETHDGVETLAEFDAVHLFGVVFDDAVRFGYEFGVDGVVEGKRAGDIGAFWDDAVVLRGDELQSPIDEVSEATVQ